MARINLTSVLSSVGLTLLFGQNAAASSESTVTSQAQLSAGRPIAAGSYPIDKAALPLIDGIYRRAETTVAPLGPNDGIANSYSLPFHGSLGGRFLEFYRGQHITLTGRGYILLRWEYAYFNRGGVLNAEDQPLVVTRPGTMFKRVLLAGRFMPDFDIDGPPGKSGLTRPGFQAITIAGTAGIASGWQNEYFYLDGTVTITQREKGLDYNISLTPVSFGQMHADLTGSYVHAGGSSVHLPIVLDPYISVSALAAPVEFNADVVSSSRIDLKWSPCLGSVRGYVVEYSFAAIVGDRKKWRYTGPGELWTTGATLDSHAKSFAFGKLKAKTPYLFRLKCYNDAGDSAFSKAIEVVTPEDHSIISPWQEKIVTTSGLTVEGSAGRYKDNFTLRASGGDVWGNADSFRFMYASAGGDLTLSARVTSPDFSSVYTKTGIMIRDGLEPGAKNIALFLEPHGRSKAQFRSVAAGPTREVGRSLAWTDQGVWLRIVRAGDRFTFENSVDGWKWCMIASRSVSMGRSLEVGLFVSSNSPKTVTASFDRVLLDGP